MFEVWACKHAFIRLEPLVAIPVAEITIPKIIGLIVVPVIELSLLPPDRLVLRFAVCRQVG
jgi:hypothetical protein